jgi:plastocyanin
MRLATIQATTRPWRRGLAVLALLAIGALIAVGCGGSSNNNQSGSPTTTAASTTTGGGTSGGSMATIQNFAFHPATLNAKAGQKATWSNDDSTTHTVTADDGSFDSGNLSPGKSFSTTLAKAGMIKYHCSIHTFMHGTVSVS